MTDDTLQEQIDTINENLDEMSNSMQDISDNLDQSNSDQDNVNGDIEDRMSTVEESSGQLLFPLSQDTIDLINEQTNIFMGVYGSMYVDDGSITVTVSATNTEYPITTGLTQGISNNFNFSNSTVVCLINGTYKIDWSMSMSSSNNNEVIEGGIMINSTPQHAGAGSVQCINGGKDILVSGTAILNLNLNDVVKLYVENDTAIHNITVTHASLSVNWLSRQ